MSNNTEGNTTTTGARDAQGGGGSNNQAGGSDQPGRSTTSEGRNNQADARRIRNRNKDKNVADTKAFRGETTKMNGHVFQTHSERTNKSQFADTMEALMIYASTAYKNYIDSMTVLFTTLEEPKVKEPEETRTTGKD